MESDSWGPDQDVILEHIHEAVSRMSCPYYQGKGICDQGCHQEPACEVDTPLVGWEQELADLAEQLAKSRKGATT